MKINNLIDIQKLIIKSYLSDIKVAVDATLGNGNDTNTIRKIFGTGVKIYAFDIQESAIKSAKENIRKDYQENIDFINDTHEYMDKYVKEKPQLIMFNLGYLPKSEHLIKTNAYTTLNAMEKAIDILSEKGIISIMFYLGHDNAREYKTLFEYIRILDSKKFKAVHINPVNQNENAPKLVIIQKGE